MRHTDPDDGRLLGVTLVLLILVVVAIVWLAPWA